MTSIQGRLATQFVKAIGLKRRLQKLADVENDAGALARRVEKLRRTDRRRPPWAIRRRWSAEHIEVSGSDLFVMTRPDSGSAGCVLLYLHGGGYMFGPFPTDWASMSRVAAETGCDLAMFLYPRAPEHHAQQTVDATVAAFDLLAERYGADGVVPIGTSAGGGLAVALAAELRDGGRPQPPCAVLISPGIDMTLTEDVGHLAASDVMLPADHVRSAGRVYGGPLGADHPLVSPTFGDLSDLPKLHVFVGTAEILLPSIETFAARARAAGTAVDLIYGTNQQHTWPIAPTPEGRQALRQIIGIVNACA